MQEALLQFIWQFQLFDQKALETTADQLPVRIRKTGYHNHDAGPDFKDARIQVDDTLWAGHVEIHVKASEWFQHGHHHDPAYGNVILHVVLQDDRPDPHSGELAHIPCIALQDRIEHALLQRYQHLRQNRLWIPCADQFHSVEGFTLRHWLNRLQIERLEEKRQLVERLLNENHQDWQETLYQLLARNFGFKVNAEPFERLTRLTPYRIISKHADQLFQLEALLLGQAGLLSGEFEEAYPRSLKQEYTFFQQKYGLTPMEPHEWNRLRLRPANFPPVRIAQLAAFFHNTQALLHLMLETEGIQPLRQAFRTEASPYWRSHYWPGKVATQSRSKRLGKGSITNLLINTVVPFIFTYGQVRGEEHLTDRALSFLEQLPPEQNHILKRWQQLGAPNRHAAHSQALLYLKKHYCDKKQCLSCEVGASLLRK